MSNKPHVLVIDAGIGNVGSVIASFNRLDCDVQKLSKPPGHDSLDLFTHAVLPGVGSFASGMRLLNDSGWSYWLNNLWCKSDRPLLGICLGMQLLASEGVEGQMSSLESIPGLNLIPGKVLRMLTSGGLVLPHVGWNSLYWKDKGHLLGKGIPDGGDMYFVHGFSFRASDPTHVLASTDYAELFASIVVRGRCFGVQFHPEKSQRLGRILLNNFLAFPSC